MAGKKNKSREKSEDKRGRQKGGSDRKQKNLRDM